MAGQGSQFHGAERLTEDQIRNRNKLQRVKSIIKKIKQDADRGKRAHRIGCLGKVSLRKGLLY